MIRITKNTKNTAFYSCPLSNFLEIEVLQRIPSSITSVLFGYLFSLQAIHDQKVWLWLIKSIVYFMLMIYSLVLVKIYPN